jgi:RNA recognition motif-containing protein
MEFKNKEQRALEVQKKALSFKKSMQLMNLFVKGFDRATTNEEELLQHFKQFGEVRNVKIDPHGFAFVSF